MLQKHQVPSELSARSRTSPEQHSSCPLEDCCGSPLLRIPTDQEAVANHRADGDQVRAKNHTKASSEVFARQPNREWRTRRLFVGHWRWSESRTVRVRGETEDNKSLQGLSYIKQQMLCQPKCLRGHYYNVTKIDMDMSYAYICC